MPASDHIEIVDYQPSHQPCYFAINEAWIRAAFELEPVDIEVMSNPQKYILTGGGHILMALCNKEVAGTCSLKKIHGDTFELTKMAVDERFRGKGIGRMLGEAIIDKAKQLGGRKLILYSNRKGSPVAIPLYFRLGFTEVPLTEQAYKRADIKMEMVL
jgi:GNAT superfamily N-acetyltransferase